MSKKAIEEFFAKNGSFDSEGGLELLTNVDGEELKAAMAESQELAHAVMSVCENTSDTFFRRRIFKLLSE